MSFDQKRNAERLPLESPIEGTASGSPVKIVDLSAIGCKIEHKEKFSLNTIVTLKFVWQDYPVDLKAKVVRMQLRPGMTYESGLQFAKTLEEAPDVIRAIIASLAAKDLPQEVKEVTGPVDDLDDLDLSQVVDFEDIDMSVRQKPKFVECSLENGKWARRMVAAAVQPTEGFITLPAEDNELDMLCKSYEYADPETRRLIRISLELTATQKKD